MPRHAERELDRIRRGIDERLHHRAHVLDALQEARLVEEAVIDGHIEAAVGLGVEEAFEAEGFHGGGHLKVVQLLRNWRFGPVAKQLD
jgi:hypothetical protein